jgi:myo-inositol-1(or 4)-monophosphatase
MTRDLIEARDTAVALAAEVGRFQLQHHGTLTASTSKAHANDLVSHVDVTSENRIVEGLRSVWPDDGILAEEGTSIVGTSGWHWVIDPLDGTRNYLSGTGPWSVCIALQQDGKTVLGVVHDPSSGESFSAIRGSGVWLNGQPTHLSSVGSLGGALLGVSFNPSLATKKVVGELVQRLLPVLGDMRRLPSALNLAYIAAGRLDCGVILDAQSWDVAAAEILATEGGALIQGAQPTHKYGVIATPLLADEFFTLAGPRVQPTATPSSTGSEERR